MADNPLAKKTKLTPGGQSRGPREPAGVFRSLELPAGMDFCEKLSGRYGWIQLFVKTRPGLEGRIGRTAKAVNPAGVLWISFPKASSGIQSDPSRDKSWESLKTHNLKWIGLISVGNDWSAFAVRPSKPGDARQAFR